MRCYLALRGSTVGSDTSPSCIDSTFKEMTLTCLAITQMTPDQLPRSAHQTTWLGCLPLAIRCR